MKTADFSVPAASVHMDISGTNSVLGQKLRPLKCETRKKCRHYVEKWNNPDTVWSADKNKRPTKSEA